MPLKVSGNQERVRAITQLFKLFSEEDISRLLATACSSGRLPLVGTIDKNIIAPRENSDPLPSWARRAKSLGQFADSVYCLSEHYIVLSKHSYEPQVHQSIKCIANFSLALLVLPLDRLQNDAFLPPSIQRPSRNASNAGGLRASIKPNAYAGISKCIGDFNDVAHCAPSASSEASLEASVRLSYRFHGQMFTVHLDYSLERSLSVNWSIGLRLTSVQTAPRMTRSQANCNLTDTENQRSAKLCVTCITGVMLFPSQCHDRTALVRLARYSSTLRCTAR